MINFLTEEIDPGLKPAATIPIDELSVGKFIDAGEKGGSAISEVEEPGGYEGLRIALTERNGGHMYLQILKNPDTGDEATDLISDPQHGKRHFRWTNGVLYEIFDDDRKPKQKDKLFEKMLLQRLKGSQV